jgi:hypothetical protein
MFESHTAYRFWLTMESAAIKQDKECVNTKSGAGPVDLKFPHSLPTFVIRTPSPRLNNYSCSEGIQ